MIALSYLLAATCAAAANDIYVNNQTGADLNAGTADAPFRTVRKAISVVAAGDTIHLLPERSVYREMVTIQNKRDFKIEGHDCVVSGADPLPSDPAKWEKSGEALHRIRLRATSENRHILVVNDRAEMMGRTKYNLGPLRTAARGGDIEAIRKAFAAQYPRPADLKDGQFAWEPVDAGSGWLYVKGPLDNLEWAVRTQCIYTNEKSENVTVRNLHARFALNDGFNLHGAALNYRLQNVTAYGCFDNGISPHGACSFSAEDSRFWGNEMAVGNDFLTQPRFLRCEIAQSTQEEVMTIGGKHLFQDCRIRAAGPVAIRLAYSRPGRDRPAALREIEMAGADPDMASQVTFRNCIIESADGKTRRIVIQPGPAVAFHNCTFKDMTFEADPAASVQVLDCTLDGKPLIAEGIKR
ncbi:MAG: hypothetical protein FJ288_04130 [Planctomycetes bacterium]|nr:hypothetical protein [Planctomycetota bacterium]